MTTRRWNRPGTAAAGILGSLARIGVLAMACAPVLAQHAHGTSPYAHAQSAEVPSLSPEEVRELRNGEGMGLARAAELNHFPGPKHLLELAPELGLGKARIGRIEEIHDRMKARAIAKGEAILEMERHLAGLFASGQPSETALARITEHLGLMRGQLQAIHLVAHVEAARELTAEQIESYDRLRGYRH